MFEQRNLPFGGNRTGNDPFRKRLFGGNGRSAAQPSAVPAMEQIAPQTTETGNDSRGAAPCPEACSLAMVYVPRQEWQEIYPIDQAIRKGTLFSELDKPFLGKTLAG